MPADKCYQETSASYRAFFDLRSLTGVYRSHYMVGIWFFWVKTLYWDLQLAFEMKKKVDIMNMTCCCS